MSVTGKGLRRTTEKTSGDTPYRSLPKRPEFASDPLGYSETGDDDDDDENIKRVERFR